MVSSFALRLSPPRCGYGGRDGALTLEGDPFLGMSFNLLTQQTMLILTTGGTIDKIYFDASSKFEVGDPIVPHIFKDVGADIDYELKSFFRKDGLEMIVENREEIREVCTDNPHHSRHGHNDGHCRSARRYSRKSHRPHRSDGSRPLPCH